MKSTGIFRRIDSLGRFVLPKELRKSFDINQNDYFQIYLDGDTIILKKSQLSCVLCGNTDDLRGLPRQEDLPQAAFRAEQCTDITKKGLPAMQSFFVYT